LNKKSTLLDRAEAALLDARAKDQSQYREAMHRFMLELVAIAHTAPGSPLWSQGARAWARRCALLVLAARDAFVDWSAETGDLFYFQGGEEATARALERRSNLELARELFRDTEAADLLDACRSNAADQEYRDQAEQYGLDPPDWVPRSHTWWLWRDR
jgi:hypothetical protein